MHLHELHRRRLEATVQMIEASLDRMERLLTPTRSSAIVRVVDNSLSSEQAALLLDAMRRLRAGLARFAAAFDLHAHRLEVRQILNAELSTAWSMLEDCRPRRLKGYGVELPAEVRRGLEQAVEELLEQLAAIRERLP